MEQTKDEIKKLSNGVLLLCCNEYKRRWRLKNKDKVKNTNNKHYNKYYKKQEKTLKKQEDILKDENNSEDILINSDNTNKISIDNIIKNRGLL